MAWKDKRNMEGIAWAEALFDRRLGGGYRGILHILWPDNTYSLSCSSKSWQGKSVARSKSWSTNSPAKREHSPMDSATGQVAGGPRLDRGHFKAADQVMQVLSKVAPKLRIKIGEWFIKQKHFWLKGKRSG
ncbi:hypothetical protein ABIB91_008172 [Bradyrhizobium sp. JR4.3]